MELIGAVMPMNTWERARHWSLSAGPLMRAALMPYRTNIVLFTSVLSLSNIIGLQRLWTMDFASRPLSMMLGSAGSSVAAQNSSAPASSSSTTAASVLAKKFVDRVGVRSVGRLDH